MSVKTLLRATTRALGIDIQRYRAQYSRGCASLRPEGRSNGAVLISYILEPFLRDNGEALSTTHTHYGESVLMAKVWLERGFAVDVIDYRNSEFVPRKRYDVFVSARTNLETIAPRLAADCVKIAHFDTSHYAFNNQASYTRLLALQQRRGVSLPGSMRLVEHNLALEFADCAVVLGNDATLNTYRYAGKPLYALPVPAAVDPVWSDDKDFASCRNRFLWFGSSSFVHKGLDVVLEAFAGMPDMHLTVCGPLDGEPAFCRAYHKELYESSNIHAVGWVDVAGEEFPKILNQCAAVVYPSCAEGQAGSIINCMRSGIIPVISRETGISTEGFGVLLPDASVAAIRTEVSNMAARSPETLAERAEHVRKYAASHHSQDSYIREYTRIVETITAQTAPSRATASRDRLPSR